MIGKYLDAIQEYKWGDFPAGMTFLIVASVFALVLALENIMVVLSFILGAYIGDKEDLTSFLDKNKEPEK